MIIQSITQSLESIFHSLPKQKGLVFLPGSPTHPHGRYQILTWSPSKIVTGKGQECQIEQNGQESVIYGNVLDSFQTIWEEERTKWDLDTMKEQNIPMVAGAIGYFAYDLRDELEVIPAHAKDDLQNPDLYFCFYDHFLVHDSKEEKTYLIAHDEIVRDAVMSYHESLMGPGQRPAPAPDNSSLDPNKIQSSMTQAEYGDAFKKIKKGLYDGRIYQINLAQRLEIPFEQSASGLFRRLVESHPAPYASYLHTGDTEIVSISPERFMFVEGRDIETCPIKGTARRGKTPQEDEKIKQELIDSIKEDAELSMIVDLERNDIGKVCEYGSVVVPKHREAIPYPTIWQIVSTVRGKLRSDVTLFDVLRATFPGGSIIGTPKIEAMKMIEELEPVKRGVYTGSIGWLDYRGNMDLSIAIRTLIVKDKKAYLHVGGGVVMDSDEEKEYDETWVKAEGILREM